MSETKDLREQVVLALQATDAETAWYLDRRKRRVVSVRHGVVSDPLLRARDVEDDELRFVEVPALTEAEIHDWMADFTDGSDDAAVRACLDERAGANLRFEERLARASQEALTAWHRFRLERVRAAADAWTERTLAEKVPGGSGLAPE